MDDSRLWDLFLAVFSVAFGKALDLMAERAKKAPKTRGKHFREP